MSKGKHHIKICCGTACHVKGATRILNKVSETLDVRGGETTADGLFSLEVTTCQNACKLAPLVNIDGELYLDTTPDTIMQVLDKLTIED